MTAKMLSDDCSRCAALCCIAHAFDKGPSFAYHKPAGLPCRNLSDDGNCRIHDRRTAAGFPGCVRYSCHGAGQRVTQEVFGGRSWRDHPDLTERMMQAFQRARQLHLWLLLLAEAAKLPLSPEQRAEAGRLTLLLTPAGRLSEAWLRDTVQKTTEAGITAFLTSLRQVAAARRHAASGQGAFPH
ncbi:hypothetical protein [Paracoccus marinaquae]|uniref:Pentapeptide repeat-containing protein n=1 Tax=Paracoccus marinaquae TaxID=2841926 RepID=A0ABS6AJQ7_9RHOB|nr:hypothetical protein [Paracoccus marinaquae]MBU3030827.1 hypothetical protein [Paracoccus marinaquae]